MAYGAAILTRGHPRRRSPRLLLVPLAVATATVAALVARSTKSKHLSNLVYSAGLRVTCREKSRTASGRAAAGVDVSSPSLTVLEHVLSPSQVGAALLAARTLANSYRVDADSVDGQPSFEYEFITDGSWRPEAQALQSVLQDPLELLLARVQESAVGQSWARSCGSTQHEFPQLKISQALVRRYIAGERRAHPVHYDHHAMVTAVCSLTPPQADSGLFVQSGAHVSSRDFVPLGAAGNFAVHGWDLAHGVEVKGVEERFSLIVWLKPSEDVLSGGTGWYEALATDGHAEAQYRLGMQAEKACEPSVACSWFQRAAEAGHWSSMHRLGELLLKKAASMTAPDAEQAQGEAEVWLRKSAQLGYAPAQVSLGDLLTRRNPDASDSSRLYSSAASQGHPAGQHRWALHHLRRAAAAAAGKSLAEAAEAEAQGESLLRLSAEQGWADSQSELGRLLVKRAEQQAQVSSETQSLDGSKVVEAKTLLLRAAQQGHPGAMNQLAVLEAKQGSHEGARDWLNKAALAGSPAAMANLALYLERGVGGPCDAVAAAEWRQRAEEARASGRR